MAAPAVVEKIVAAGGSLIEPYAYSGLPYVTFRGVPIRVVDSLLDIPEDMPVGRTVRIKLPPEGWQRLKS